MTLTQRSKGGLQVLTNAKNDEEDDVDDQFSEGRPYLHSVVDTLDDFSCHPEIYIGETSLCIVVYMPLCIVLHVCMFICFHGCMNVCMHAGVHV